MADFKTHPLIPGSLLASVANHARAQGSSGVDQADLLRFNKLITLEIVGELQNTQIITAEQATKILDVDGRFLRYYRDLNLNIPEVAEVTGCDLQAVHQLARALFSVRLMSEYLEILISPQLSYEKTSHGTVDLLAALFDCFRQIVGGAWSVFFPRGEFGLVSDAAAQFWVSCLYSSRPEE